MDRACLRCFCSFEEHSPVGRDLACPDGRGSYVEPSGDEGDELVSFLELERGIYPRPGHRTQRAA